MLIWVQGSGFWVQRFWLILRFVLDAVVLLSISRTILANPHPATRNLHSVTRDQRPETSGQKPRTACIKHTHLQTMSYELLSTRNAIHFTGAFSRINLISLLYFMALFRPACLAAYMAASAFFKRSSISAPSSG